MAPDSFKGTATAAEAAGWLRQGWLAERPDDEVVGVPMADGGEGTLAVLRANSPDATWRPARVTGPVGAPVDAGWLLLADGTAVVELATCSGLPILTSPDPLRATTFGVGQLISAALDDQATRRVLLALGGSATTDGGTGALSALGARFVGPGGRQLSPGGGDLRQLETVDLTALHPPPPEGITCLVDVVAPLLGPSGAAAQFGPQKGADLDQVRILEEGLGQLAAVLGGDPERAGAGAAGGTSYGFVTVWGAQLAPGALTIAGLAGLPELIASADLVVTGEGRYDGQSHQGKVVGCVVDLARQFDVNVHLVAGSVAAVAPPPVSTAVDLTTLAGDRRRAAAEVERWLMAAGRQLAAGAAGSDG